MFLDFNFFALMITFQLCIFIPQISSFNGTKTKLPRIFLVTLLFTCLNSSPLFSFFLTSNLSSSCILYHLRQLLVWSFLLNIFVGQNLRIISLHLLILLEAFVNKIIYIYKTIFENWMKVRMIVQLFQPFIISFTSGTLCNHFYLFWRV